jgi:hypothetical protein
VKRDRARGAGKPARRKRPLGRKARSVDEPGRPKQPVDELKSLEKTVAGLTYPSESDVPFDVLSWPAGGETARDAVVANAGRSRPVEEVPVEQFFSELEETDDAVRYRELRRALEAALSDLRVLRVGSVKVDVYLVGRTRSGAWAGLHTTSVET